MKNVHCFLNAKGGTGKTSLCLNVAHGLSLCDKQVLVIDFDGQCNLSESIGVENYQNNIYDIILGNAEPKPEQVRKNLHVIPALPELNLLEQSLGASNDGLFELKRIIDRLSNHYDYVFIDSMPSFGSLVLNAINASNYVQVILQTQYLASSGLRRLLEVCDNVKNEFNPELEIGGIVLNMLMKNTVLGQNVLQVINTDFTDIVYNQTIRFGISMAEAPALQKTVLEHAKGSLVAMDIRNLTIEFLNRFPK